MIIIVMGVSGAGKSTVGRPLAEALDFQFADADDYHSDENRTKMTLGQSLTDQDREPWLAALSDSIQAWQKAGVSCVLACSALKKIYRQRLLQAAANDYLLVYLKSDFDKIHARLLARQNHFMKAEMLKSQFAALEEPDPAEDKNVLVVNAELPLVTIVAHVSQAALTGKPRGKSV